MCGESVSGDVATGLSLLSHLCTHLEVQRLVNRRETSAIELPRAEYLELGHCCSKLPGRRRALEGFAPISKASTLNFEVSEAISKERGMFIVLRSVNSRAETNSYLGACQSVFAVRDTKLFCQLGDARPSPIQSSRVGDPPPSNHHQSMRA